MTLAIVNGPQAMNVRGRRLSSRGCLPRSALAVRNTRVERRLRPEWHRKTAIGPKARESAYLPTPTLRAFQANDSNRAAKQSLASP